MSAQGVFLYVKPSAFASSICKRVQLVHAANDWTNTDNPRCAVFNCYNSIWAQWHRLNLSHEVIETMPTNRQSLFRGTWAIGGGPGGNREYSLEITPHNFLSVFSLISSSTFDHCDASSLLAGILVFKNNHDLGYYL